MRKLERCHFLATAEESLHSSRKIDTSVIGEIEDVYLHAIYQCTGTGLPQDDTVWTSRNDKKTKTQGCPS
ncbi:hypothetical protein ILYODFUR_038804 [Ilyodon furcidens]|uniref:Uncharacterized protein n=1 Tax=Ilyodon furcidens TaxID=33524 RepID=A0ABV0U1B4_9TELE